MEPAPVPATPAPALPGRALSPLAFFRRAARVYGDRLAVVDGEVRLSYREFAERCLALARGLARLGVAPGDRVAVLASNTHRALEVYYAVPLAGAVLVPLNIRLSAGEYRYILEHSGARLLLADPQFREMALSLRQQLPRLRVLSLDEESEAVIRDQQSSSVDVSRGSSGASGASASSNGAAGRGAGSDPAPIDLDALDENSPITINYTSGTTAHPKGVVLTHRNAALNALDFIIHGRLTVDDVYLHTLPMFHVNGWGGVWAVTAAGGTHICLPRIDPARVLELIDTHGVTMACSAPTVLVMLAGDPAAGGWRAGRPLRWYVGGAPPPAALIRRVEGEMGIEIVHVYGLTETSPWLTVCEWRHEWDPLPLEQQAEIKARQGIGQLLAGEVRVVREDLSEVAADGREIGEIVVRGPTVMQGYYNDPEATAQAMTGGWLHTGDLAVVHPGGYLQVVDRKKDVILSGGENVSSVEVEGVLYRHPAVLEAAVVAAPDPKWGEVPQAFVVLRAGAAATEEELIRFCRERIAHFKAPKRVEFLEALPKTATGKVQKYLLRKRVTGGVEESSGRTAS